jgi:SAM-dependent methyltransferase
MQMGPEEISERLRTGQPVMDADFDTWLPDTSRRASSTYWTKVGVAVRVARWLSSRGVSSVLDVGAGPGKFCVVGALSSGMTFTGLEHRLHLVAAAQALATRFDVTRRASFAHGDLDTLDFRHFDALYLYNPFAEHVFARADRLDGTVEVSHARFEREIAKAEYLLGRMPVGSHLVTYNGYGGRVPDSFDLIHAKMAGHDPLRLWHKARERDGGGHWIELEDATVLYAGSSEGQAKLDRIGATPSKRKADS